MLINTGSLRERVGVAAMSKGALLMHGTAGAQFGAVARKVHQFGDHREWPFLILEAARGAGDVRGYELFGHAVQKGDARLRRLGLLELADGGSLLLEEISNLALSVQERLAKYMREGPSENEGDLQVGGPIRIIASSSKDLEQLVTSGRFSRELLKQLGVNKLILDPLKERADEFDEIFHDCLDAACRAVGKVILSITEEAAGVLEEYEWPGDVEELNAVLRYAVVRMEGATLKVEDLPAWLFSKSPGPGPGAGAMVRRPPKNEDFAEISFQAGRLLAG